MAQEREVTIDSPLDFVENIIAEFNNYITANPTVSSDGETAPLDAVLERANEFSDVYAKRKRNINLKYVVLGVLLCLVFESTLPDDEGDTDDPLLSKAGLLQ